jgi:hypothetical protein
MVAKIILCAALLLSLVTPARALCRDDLKDIKPRIDRLKTASPQRYFLALKWYGRAIEAEPGSEVECLNFLAMTRKAVTEPITEIAGCVGPNAYLPNCQVGGPQNPNLGPEGMGPVAPLTGGGGNGRTSSFGAAGSVGAGGNSEATGTGRVQ